ncbi:MAG: hypothetical protein AAF609_08455 [Cyanobacteria bacterium P01_C01_bin.120]
MNRKSPWKNTAEACQRLNVSRWTLSQMRRDHTLKKGHHWKVKNPSAARLTYLWHVDRIDKLQGKVLTAD